MSHTITITVGANGKLDYNGDDSLVIGPGEKLRWFCANAFTIIFSIGDSPFYPDHAVSSGRAGQNSGYQTIRTPKDFPSVHKYTAVVFDGNDMIVDDPIIIIDDDGGGGPAAGGKGKGKGGKKPK